MRYCGKHLRVALGERHAFGVVLDARVRGAAATFGQESRDTFPVGGPKVLSAGIIMGMHHDQAWSWLSRFPGVSTAPGRRYPRVVRMGSAPDANHTGASSLSHRDSTPSAWAQRISYQSQLYWDCLGFRWLNSDIAWDPRCHTDLLDYQAAPTAGCFSIDDGALGRYAATPQQVRSCCLESGPRGQLVSGKGMDSRYSFGKRHTVVGDSRAYIKAPVAAYVPLNTGASSGPRQSRSKRIR
jgi:hypothetical protein